MPVLQVYFPSKQEIALVKKEAKRQGYPSAAAFIRDKVLNTIGDGK